MLAGLQAAIHFLDEIEPPRHEDFGPAVAQGPRPPRCRPSGGRPDPKLVTVVLINEPGGDLYHAGVTAAPAFSSIMGGALQLLNIPPDDKQVTSTQWLTGGQHGS